ncbi:hypothetical protein [Streptomyces tsukubensis]|nr:hypothetical protein [Streptomyces tsukubensis]
MTDAATDPGPRTSYNTSTTTSPYEDKPEPTAAGHRGPVLAAPPGPPRTP